MRREEKDVSLDTNQIKLEKSINDEKIKCYNEISWLIEELNSGRFKDKSYESIVSAMNETVMMSILKIKTLKK